MQIFLKMLLSHYRLRLCKKLKSILTHKYRLQLFGIVVYSYTNILKIVTISLYT